MGSPARSSPQSQGSEVTERFSRKVFVGGLPPDIDEGQCGRLSVRVHSPLRVWQRRIVINDGNVTDIRPSLKHVQIECFAWSFWPIRQPQYTAFELRLIPFFIAAPRPSLKACKLNALLKFFRQHANSFFITANGVLRVAFAVRRHGYKKCVRVCVSDSGSRWAHNHPSSRGIWLSTHMRRLLSCCRQCVRLCCSSKCTRKCSLTNTSCTHAHAQQKSAHFRFAHTYPERNK